MKKIAIAMLAACMAIVLAACGASSSSGTSGANSASSSGETSSEAAERAEAEAQAAAEAEAAAALEEGMGYWFGTGTEGYDKEKARAAFKKAAEGGNADAWYWMGTLALYDVDADRWPQVIDYYQKAADAGSAKGWCGLGVLYETGCGVEVDAAKAKELYHQAIDAGELHGSLRMGDLYCDGNGVEASGTKAAELYEQAAASPDFDTRNAARCALARMYRYGAEGIEPDVAKAFDLYQKAADENYYAGWRGLAHLYDDPEVMSDDRLGATMDYDSAKAFEYYSKEAALGSAYNLGVCYEYGDGCEVDYAKAIELFTQEANGSKNAAYAMCGLAYMAVEGMGMDQDHAVAADWCNKAIAAAAPGDVGAVEYANELLEWLANNA